MGRFKCQQKAIIKSETVLFYMQILTSKKQIKKINKSMKDKFFIKIFQLTFFFFLFKLQCFASKKKN